MCGIAGFFAPGGWAVQVGQAIAHDMSARLVHRGPDDSGLWMDAQVGIALAHRRLAVLDLSATGRQPMSSPSGRFVVVFNGELYNHREIRAELQRSAAAPLWRGHSDTETLLAALDQWGIEASLEKFAGMFAFALWDRDEGSLILARDRIGEKPLYYGWQGDVLLFASELKALRVHPAFRGDVDRNALALYLRHGYIPAPQSIYRGIHKLTPGSYVCFSARSATGGAPVVATYWTLQDAARRGAADPFEGSDAQAVDELGARLHQAVSLQSVADVPVGAFLSGGVDSSVVAALMQAQSSRRIKTFTIGFGEASHDEARYAHLVSRHLGAEHTELYVTPRETMEMIPKLPQLYDEPFGDSSAIPTMLVAGLARREVTVALSGDGGDELFGGYTRYQRTCEMWSAMRRIPYLARVALSRGVEIFANHDGSSALARKAGRLVPYLAARNVAECYHARISQRHNLRDWVLGSDEQSRADAAPCLGNLHEHPYGTMRYADTLAYLPDDILVKVDRAAMGVSLETRVPMLDHRVVEFAWRLPLRLLVRGGEGKWLLKQLLRRYVPVSLTSRPKMGFGIPIGQWLRGPLRDWAEDLLSEGALAQAGFLNPRPVRAQWSRHLRELSAEADGVWQVLMFQAWTRESLK